MLVDQITLLINGVSHSLWEMYSIDSNLLTPADGWQVSLGIDRQTIPASIFEGASVILHADGSVSVNSAASVSITATDTVTVNAPLVNVPNGDVTASGISLINHKHTGVQAGSSQTGIAI